MALANEKRFYLNLGENSFKDLQITGFEGEETLSFSANDEWCGDSVSGFGATVSVELDKEKIKTLANFLNDWLAKN